MYKEPTFAMSDNNNKMEIPSDYKSMSILQLMEVIAEQAEHSHLSDRFFNHIRPLTTILSEKLDLSPVQCALYSLFIDNYDDSQIRLEDIRQQTDARMIRLAQLQSDIDAIEAKRYIRRGEPRYGGGCQSDGIYYVPFESLKDLRNNRAYSPRKVTNLSFSAFMHELDTHVKECYDLGEPYELLVQDMLDITSSNTHLKVAKRLMEMKDTFEDSREWAMLVVMCTCELFHGKRFGLTNLGKIFEEEWECHLVAESFEQETNGLLRHGLVEFDFAGGIADRNSIVLSRKAKKLLLSEYKKHFSGEANNLRQNSKIATKELFYNEEVRCQIDRLNDLLSKKSFAEICKRMKQHGMRRGFACIFYGAPGTGKTETVLQLAKRTGRNIMQVDFSEIKNKYVGETEKNVKAIFDNYRDAVNCEKLCPILLFNEADAIIGKRLDNVEHSVDNMYNAMQNIILQEMENFEGILIATTNLESNMDSAFERRFLYKVRFEKPTPEVRKQIWQSIIPTLNEEVALALAQENDFSGGQIENIARKQVVDNILYGESDDLYASLTEYCRCEAIENRRARPNIGFSIRA